ncbi:hypothetical protein WN944_013912 [Citrus x changshan-huyou]|uniref:Uncharacterized protein n=1 Tax=Citrus x changshan-huyou TaxID=2935761 RepID=A0AAP0QKB1_9ROSI
MECTAESARVAWVLLSIAMKIKFDSEHVRPVKVTLCGYALSMATNALSSNIAHVFDLPMTTTKIHRFGRIKPTPS